MNKESYNSISNLWDAARISLSKNEERILECMLEGVSTPSHVLDLGCGTGRPIAEYCVQRGHKVTGVDQSIEMLRIAQTRLEEQHWVLSSIEDYKNEQFFDAVIAWDSLFHIQREKHEAIFNFVKSVLRQGRKFALTVGGSSHPAFTDTMFEKTFFYDSHPPQVAVSMLESLGFKVVISEFLNPPTSGRDKGRFAIVVEKL